VHINTRGINMAVSPELQRYAESRLWMAAHRSPRRVGWAGAVLEREGGDGGTGQRVTCRADAWVRELGLVSARGSSVDPFVAVDLATQRLELAIARRAHRPLPAADRARHAESAWRPDVRRPHDPGAGLVTAGGDRGAGPVRTRGGRFMDYDPVAPDWPA
jgi:ribosome-associated translation inhibitor RaiA